MPWHPGPPEEHLDVSKSDLHDLDEAFGSVVGKTWSEPEMLHWLRVSENAVIDDPGE